MTRVEALGNYNHKRARIRASNYAEQLKLFVEQQPALQALLDMATLDHLAFKAAGPFDYERFLFRTYNYCLEASQITRDERRLGTFFLRPEHALKVGDFGSVTAMEVLEPKPGSIGLVGVDHTEFYTPNFSEVLNSVEEAGIEHKVSIYPEHRSIVIVINSQGQEVKFTDQPLKEIVEQQEDKYRLS